MKGKETLNIILFFFLNLPSYFFLVDTAQYDHTILKDCFVSMYLPVPKFLERNVLTETLHQAVVCAWLPVERIDLSAENQHYTPLPSPPLHTAHQHCSLLLTASMGWFVLPGSVSVLGNRLIEGAGGTHRRAFSLHKHDGTGELMLSCNIQKCNMENS